MRIMGVDPGLRITGYGVVETPGSTLVEAGCLRLDERSSVSDRLLELEVDVEKLLARFRPDAVAVEIVFAHYKHPATAVVMAHARGVLLLCVRRANLPLIELRPTEIKKSLTGHGHASKEQMQDGVMARLNLAARPEPPDVADAIAIALCAQVRWPA